MGWSCSQAAGRIHDRWIAACRKSTGSSNTWDESTVKDARMGAEKGTAFFFETSNREHADGAITGTIMKMLPFDRCHKVGTFRINGDGTIARAPKFLRDAALIERGRFEGPLMPGSGGM